jgi:hypothetical protein
VKYAESSLDKELIDSLAPTGNDIPAPNG